MDFLSLSIAIISGIILGIITGITPGIHINLISSVIVAYSHRLLEILDPITISITITSMAITHTVFDIIPSTILGIPDTENLTMLLPAHKLTLEGKAKLGIIYGLFGSTIGILTTVALIPISLSLIHKVYEGIKYYIPFILIGISAYTIYKSRNKKLALVFFLTSGILGILAFNIKTLNQPLLPLLSGLFGLSALVLSLQNKIELKEQLQNIKIDISLKRLFKYSVYSTLASLMTNFLPGLTSSHTAIIADKLNKTDKQEEYIIISNATNASATIISFIALYTINKTRSGAVAAIQFILGEINKNSFLTFIAISLITLGLTTFFALKLSSKIINLVNKINYKKITILILIIIIIITLAITRLEGLLLLITATSLGILTDRLKIEKIVLTGCLIFPVILYLL